VPEIKLFSGVFDDMNVDKKIKTLPDYQQRAMQSVFAKVSSRQKLDIADVMTIFESSVFSTTEKQKIIESYMPSMTVAQAIDL
jgi:endonuclease/exonuclease/phosphatase (EEP) superfamily protein YafD